MHDVKVKSYRDLSNFSYADEEGKFVILGHQKKTSKDYFLIFSPLELTPYHANIVYQFLQVEGRGKVEAVSSSGCRILSKGWQVHGGGHYQLDYPTASVILHGKSTAFGKYQAELLDPYVHEIPLLLGLEGFFLELK